MHNSRRYIIMKKMKKVLAVALSLVMAGSLAACGSSSTETKASETAAIYSREWFRSCK